MAKRLTPIERAIEGEPADRRIRYQRSLPSKGLSRVTVIVPSAHVDEIKARARDLRERFAAASDASLGDDHD